MSEATACAASIGRKELAAMLGFSVETLYRRRTNPLPAGAVVFSRDGKTWARWTDKRGEPSPSPIH